ncbi:MAG: ATP-binding cassette domain-containing protein, partial [Clostridia bacterium]|nr:ATP-binding cassette domain-containing protein [Clostridia bacterium]
MILEMRGIVKEYVLGRTVSRVLDHVDLTVEEGEYLAIMGPSGSGKTTLLNLIGCLDVPTSGDYTFAGRDVTKLSQTALADLRNREVGFVFQSFYLLANMNAIENVALPLLYQGVRKKERMARAAEALRTVGLEDRMKYRPDQL